MKNLSHFSQFTTMKKKVYRLASSIPAAISAVSHLSFMAALIV